MKAERIALAIYLCAIALYIGPMTLLVIASIVGHRWLRVPFTVGAWALAAWCWWGLYGMARGRQAMKTHDLLFKGLAVLYVLAMIGMSIICIVLHEWLLLPFSVGCGGVAGLALCGAWDDRDPDDGEGE